MPVCRRKVTVIGAGNVGATAAQRIAEAGIADVYLVDVVEGLPQGKALDLLEAAPLQHHDQMIYGTNDYADTTESDVIVVTAGMARLEVTFLVDADGRPETICSSRTGPSFGTWSRRLLSTLPTRS